MANAERIVAFETQAEDLARRLGPVEAQASGAGRADVTGRLEAVEARLDRLDARLAELDRFAAEARQALEGYAETLQELEAAFGEGLAELFEQFGPLIAEGLLEGSEGPETGP